MRSGGRVRDERLGVADIYDDFKELNLAEHLYGALIAIGFKAH